MNKGGPKLLIFTTLFPSSARPTAGVFIRERMFRVGKYLPIVVVSPTPWFPFQSILRRFRPSFRPPIPKQEIQDGVDGVEVYYPRFFSIPGYGRWLDGWSMAICSVPILWRLRPRFNIIDSHFAYPDGYGATLLGKWFKVPVTITLRGTEVPLSRFFLRRYFMLQGLKNAARVFSVADSLKQYVVKLGADSKKIKVVGNGVDVKKFSPVSKIEACQKLSLDPNGVFLISVGGLVERKGFHRVIEVLPALRKKFPNLQYLIVGGSGPEGDMSVQLRQQVQDLRLDGVVHFLGSIAAKDLKWPLSAADIFVLSTRNEGWANVFLEAMACELPVITTDVGGNREVISDSKYGMIVPFGDSKALESALDTALSQSWDRESIRTYAGANQWEYRVSTLVGEFKKLAN
ncbi:glycosyltransferase [Candidatus Nitrosacidococcus sp. I8]|uniref:glycosyltransferase n=1 Tax=Candidatus Nitrosacidococcus sp. I8 TaxID=2942908 RepID=UPI00222666E7|nr:glycosyltransferase [Candidatus Nitrosacidococcus sp. I8]CAH9019190.1 Putative teichuronic acid biosynthesis glycosyltransferase TuaC [Candidatus Nitrosacidococcus sp. I8]